MARGAVSVPREASAARRPNRSAMVLLFGASAAAWKYMKVSGSSFVSGLPKQGLRSSTPKQQRRAFAFDLVESDEHVGFKTQKEEDGIVTAMTEGAYIKGNWNTVVGSQELPASGRAYWEVKFVEKPSDAFEYIGVAEASSDVTMPLTKNSKGKGYFFGACSDESMAYQYLETQSAWKDSYLAKMKKEWISRGGDEKKTDEGAKMLQKGMWEGPGKHVGTMPLQPMYFKAGTVVGIDADMDKGTLSFWENGKLVGPLMDLTGRPVNIKGKKLVPAMSIFGRDMGGRKEFTKVEVRTGLEPPALP